MKLTITLNEEYINGTITELEAKGCYEVAEAIENGLKKELARRAREEYRNTWTYGFYKYDKNGELHVLYVNHRTKRFSRKPIYVDDKLMGRNIQKSFDTYLRHTLEFGYEEV